MTDPGSHAQLMRERVTIDIYLRSASGASLHEAVVAGEPLSDDLSRFEAGNDARAGLLSHLETLVKERWLWSVEDSALVIGVLGLPAELSRVFGCQVRSTGALRCELSGEPSLPGYDGMIEAIESTGRTVLGAPAVECEVFGHDWDILLFDSPHGLLECMRCDRREGTFN